MWFPVPERPILEFHTSAILKLTTEGSAFAGYLPGREPFRVEVGRTADLIVIRWIETDPTCAPVLSDMSTVDLNALLPGIGSHRSYADLKAQPSLAPEFGLRRMLIVLDVVNDCVDGDAWSGQVVDWLNDEPLTKVLADNLERVRAAIPTPPEWDIKAIANACWVVENADRQGTAFHLEGTGFVTCHHVLFELDGTRFPDAVVFHTDDPGKRYPVENVRANGILDLAVFSSSAPLGGSLISSPLQDVEMMTHVAVCGFPNFRLGTSCVVSPGTIVAHRMWKGGVRRLLTNAGIVVGMSGGPAVTDGREVVGVFANGAPYMQDTDKTEDQAIVPITALALLLN